MSKPVNKTDFWKDRLKNASVLHHSVYITSPKDWDFLNKEHTKILEPYKDKKVLDAGCGYGRWADFFSNYKGVDLSPDLIDKAKALYPNKDFMVGLLEDLPFKDKEFDMSFCVSIKHMIIANLGEEQWNKMFKELQRVSKEVLILEYTDPHIYEKYN